MPGDSSPLHAAYCMCADPVDLWRPRSLAHSRVLHLVIVAECALTGQMIAANFSVHNSAAGRYDSTASQPRLTWLLLGAAPPTMLSLRFDTARAVTCPKRQHTAVTRAGCSIPVRARLGHPPVITPRTFYAFRRPFKSRAVKGGDKVDLGGGHVIEFVMAPNLHWPDTMFSFDHATGACAGALNAHCLLKCAYLLGAGKGRKA